MQNIFYINGQYLPENEANIHITDLGLLRGYGVFDFFRAVNGHVLFLEHHLDRFEYSTGKFDLAIPYTRFQLMQIIDEIILANKTPLLGIKLIVTGGYSEDGYTPTKPNFIIIAKPFTFLETINGMQLMALDYLRELPDIKSLNYMVPIYHRHKMLQIGAHDYLYHKNGNISELSRSNIFLVKNEKIITPATNILHGVTRKHVLKIAQKHFEIEERDVSLEETFAADELFTTGSTKKITAITKIDQLSIGDGKIGRISKYLLSEFEKYELENYAK